MGGLGWNVSCENLRKKAYEVLQKAGMQDEQFGGRAGLAPGCREGQVGSMVNIWFRTPEDLLEAKIRVQSINAKVSDGPGTAWVNAALTPAERQPGQRFGIVKSCFKQVETSLNQNSFRVNKQMCMLSCSSSAAPDSFVDICRIIDNEVEWTQTANDRFPGNVFKIAERMVRAKVA